MELQERFEDRRDDFAILTFHDDSVKSFAELDPKLEQVERNTWNGRKLPFPILLDASGATLATYGINGFPTTIAIDPDGRIVKGDGAMMLEDHLLSTSEEVQELLAGLRTDFSKHLAKALRRKDDPAAFALSRYGQDSATDEEVARIAEALEKIGGKFAEGFFLGERGLESSSKDERLLAVRALKKLTTLEDDFLIKTLERVASKDSDPDVREAAWKGLSALGMSRARQGEVQRSSSR